MKRFILLLISFLGLSSLAIAQEIQVKNFQKLERDLTARTKPRFDLNENPCALIKIETTGKDFQIEGNVIGEPIYQKGEVLVYVTQGIRRLTLKHERFGVLRYEFPEKIVKQVVYELSLKLIEDKNNKMRTLVMPVLNASSSHLSYGMMVGIVKKTGGYIKVNTDFGSVSSDADSNSGSTDYWYSGDESKSRFAITAGVLQRLWKTGYLYAGAGYGTRNMAWETVEGQWVKIEDRSYEGVEVELGGIVRFGGVALSLGVQTNQFKKVEGTVGIGIMF